MTQMFKSIANSVHSEWLGCKYYYRTDNGYSFLINVTIFIICFYFTLSYAPRMNNIYHHDHH